MKKTVFLIHSDKYNEEDKKIEKLLVKSHEDLDYLLNLGPIVFIKDKVFIGIDQIKKYIDEHTKGIEKHVVIM